MSGILDSLSPSLRHFVLMLVGSGLTTLIAHQADVLKHVPAAYVPIAGAVLGIFITAITPFTAQYGVGSSVGSTTFPDVAGE